MKEYTERDNKRPYLKATNLCHSSSMQSEWFPRYMVLCTTYFFLCEQEIRVVNVRNGFARDYMPGGYRDVNVNVVVEGHVCEVQLHLRPFYRVKADHQEVYEWARALNVTFEMRPDDLFKNVSREVTEAMIDLAKKNWFGLRFITHQLLVRAGRYAEGREVLEEVWLCNVLPAFVSTGSTVEMFRSTDINLRSGRSNRLATPMRVLHRCST